MQKLIGFLLIVLMNPSAFAEVALNCSAELKPSTSGGHVITELDQNALEIVDATAGSLAKGSGLRVTDNRNYTMLNLNDSALKRSSGARVILSGSLKGRAMEVSIRLNKVNRGIEFSLVDAFTDRESNGILTGEDSGSTIVLDNGKGTKMNLTCFF